MNHVKLLIIIIILLMIAGKVCYGNSDLEMLSYKSETFAEIMHVAESWKDAVLKKDIESLVSFALPEDAPYVRNKLNNNKSELYRTIFDCRHNKQTTGYCIHDTLKNIKELKITIVKHKSLEKWGNGVSIYYYDGNKIDPKFPLDDNEVIKLINKGCFISRFFFKSEGRWYTTYNE